MSWSLLCRRFISVKKQVALLMTQRKPVVIDEKRDVEEQRARGSGPGGQCVNVSSNKVRLVHKPTGLIVESHKTRHVIFNRRDALKKLATLLDRQINGDASLENIKAMLARERARKHHKQAREKYAPGASTGGTDESDS